jgi:hypothetical protein
VRCSKDLTRHVMLRLTLCLCRCSSVVGAMMAYTSSWGEANPNGGKEVVDEYLERTKLDVMETEKYLRQILGYLNLEPLPPSKNP